MSHANIHWKGCPYHRLPRIRYPSSHGSTYHCNHSRQAHLAAEEVFQLPFGSALDQAREKQRQRARKRAQRQAKDLHHYSIMQVPELEKPLDVTTNPDAGVEEKTVRREYAHMGPLVPVRSRRGITQRMPLAAHAPTYDPRLPIKNPRRVRSGRLASVQVRQTRRMSRNANNGPLTVSAPRKASVSKYSGKPRLAHAAIPSRTSSQKKALRHFTRGLKKHLIAAEAIRKASLSSSTADTSILSVHTIPALLPYRAEFEAAGLAVTSEEQLRKSPKTLQRRRMVFIPADGVSLHHSLDGSGDREVGKFEPQDRCNSCDTEVTNETVIAFTPIGHVMAHTEKKDSTPRTPRVKRSLPWLRKPNSQPPSMPPPVTSAVKVESPSNGTEHTTETTICDFDLVSPVLVRRHHPNDDLLRAFPQPPTTVRKTAGTITISPTRLPPSAPVQRQNEDAAAANTTNIRAEAGVPMMSGALPLTPPITIPVVSIPDPRAFPPLHPPSPSICLPSRRSSNRTPRILTSDLGIQDEHSTLEHALDNVLKAYYPPEEPFVGISDLIAQEPGSEDNASRTSEFVRRSRTSSMIPLLVSTRAPSISTIKDDKSARAPTMATSITQSTSSRAEIKDRDVLRGLQVALAAACDPEIDAMIREVAGCSVRRFLADLTVFDNMGFNRLAGMARRSAARKRKKFEEAKRGGEVSIPGSAVEGEGGLEGARAVASGGGEGVGDVI